MDKYAAIILSRQPLRPTGDTAWVRRTAAALLWLKDQRLGVISSIGMQTWEMVTALASDFDLPTRLYLPGADGPGFTSECEQLIYDYDLDPSQTEFLQAAGVPEGDRRAILAGRDRAVCERADLLLPVSIRKPGSMAERIERAVSAGRAVDNRFQTPHESRSEPIKMVLDTDKLSGSLRQLSDEYVVHWTRGISHPWPGERKIDFYRAIARSESWPRSGMATLERIVESRTILAGTRHMPRGVSTVSFSSLPPSEVIPLMRWRARYGEMSFEPYGIGVDRRIAARTGICPVDYYRDDDKKSIAAESLWLSQSQGRITDWRGEKEYRHLGDLSLEQLPPDSLALFCRTAAEADRLRRPFPYRVIPFLS